MNQDTRHAHVDASSGERVPERFGVFVYVEKGYGFIKEPCGLSSFLRGQTLRESRKPICPARITELDGKRVRFKTRPSNDPRHAGKMEACEVALAPVSDLLPG